MLKLILLVALGYFFYRVLKTWMTRGGHILDETEHGRAEIDDVLVQDPVCQTYIARRSSLHLTQGGERFYFCSEECRDRYLEAHPEAHQ